MLTGYADLASAVEAINKGSIFRFLTKPCSPELMTAVLEASIEQHRVVTAESVLLDRTLNGCVHVLTEILGLVNPNAFGRSMRLRRYIRRAIQHLSLRDPWQYEMAAMLSHIGCVSVPPDVLMKLQANHILRREEREMYDAHPVVGGRLLAEIPYLEPVAQMVARQNDPSIAPSDIRRDGDRVAVGAALLRLAKEFDELASRKVGLGEVLVVLQGLGYDPELVQALAEAAAEDEAMVIVPTRVRDLSVGAIVDEDVFATNGMLLVSNGQEVTPTVLERLHNFALGIGVVEPFRARVPRRAA
jgi:response regulator RpfG family c-di-GMP phosphodiesterase